jgi:hypothetical protein
VEYHKKLTSGPIPEQLEANEIMMDKLLKENKEIKDTLEKLEMGEKEKFDEIKKKLGLEYPVTSLIAEKLP